MAAAARSDCCRRCCRGRIRRRQRPAEQQEPEHLEGHSAGAVDGRVPLRPGPVEVGLQEEQPGRPAAQGARARRQGQRQGLGQEPHLLRPRHEEEARPGPSSLHCRSFRTCTSLTSPPPRPTFPIHRLQEEERGGAESAAETEQPSSGKAPRKRKRKRSGRPADAS